MFRACRWMSTKKILITGGTDGIGREAAEQLAKLGHAVTISGRNSMKAKEIMESVENTIKYIHSDLSDLQKTREFADIVAGEKFDIYIMNAGIMHPEKSETKDGIDMTIMTNLIAPYIIFQEVLKKHQDRPIHFVFVTSILLKFFSATPIGTLMFDPKNVESWRVAMQPEDASGAMKYAISKIGQAAMALWVNELNLEGVSATSVHPGTVVTNIMNGLPARHQMYIKMCRPFITKKESAGSNIVQAALCPLPPNMYYLADKKCELPKFVNSAETLTAFAENFQKFDC